MPLSTPARPPRVSIDADGIAFVLVRVDDERYAVEVAGTRRLLEIRREWREVGESGWSRSWDPNVEVGETAKLDEVLRCLELVAPRPIEHGIELEVAEAGGHFRRNTFAKITIRIGDDLERAVEIVIEIAEQDESYY